MPTDRLARFRSWPSGVYTDELARSWRREHPQRIAPLVSPPRTEPEARFRIAVVCHVFYTDLLGELQSVLRNLPVSTDLFVSVVSEGDGEAVRAEFAHRAPGLVDVRVVENRGRDIAPKYVAFSDVYQREYDLLLFLHTKKSTYEHVGTPWRRYLYGALAGSRERVDDVLDLFARDRRLGIVAPQHFGAVAADTIWQGTFLYASRMARRMRLQVRRWAPPDFASGSMFWARPEALAAITRLELRLDEFPPEARQVTATNMHALERLVFLAAEHEGYRVAMVGSDGPRGLDAVEPLPEEHTESPSMRMRLAALPPTVRRMAADVEIRRQRFSPRRVVPLLVRRLRRLPAEP